MAMVDGKLLLPGPPHLQPQKPFHAHACRHFSIFFSRSHSVRSFLSSFSRQSSSLTTFTVPYWPSFCFIASFPSFTNARNLSRTVFTKGFFLPVHRQIGRFLTQSLKTNWSSLSSCPCSAKCFWCFWTHCTNWCFIYLLFLYGPLLIKLNSLLFWFSSITAQSSIFFGFCASTLSIIVPLDNSHLVTSARDTVVA